jgi:hypothetical protein
VCEKKARAVRAKVAAKGAITGWQIEMPHSGLSSG